MAGKIKSFPKLIQLYGLYTRMDLAWFLRDTKFFLLAVSADFISNIAAISGIFLLAWKFNGVGGMDKYEVLFMLGFVTLVTGVYQTLFAGGNTGHISRRIGRGQLEHMLIQPVPMPVQLLTEGFIPVSGSSSLLTGGIITFIALKNLGIHLTMGWFVLFAVNIFTSLVIILSLQYIFSSAAFYAPVQAEEISTYVSEATGSLGAYPLSGMPLAVQIPLISVFPAGLLGWFPCLAMLGKAPLGLPSFYPILVAMLLFIITNFVFRKGLKHYVKTGTNRYSAVGHRR